MNHDVDAGLRDWLAYREQLAGAITRPAAVLARVDAAVADAERPSARSRPRRLAPLVVAVAMAALLMAVLSGSLGLRSSRNNAPAGPQRPWIRGTVPASPPPVGTPVVWVQDPQDHFRLIAFDWGGNAVGQLRLPSQGKNFSFPQFTASPDGSRLVVERADGHAEQVLSSHGALLATIPDRPENTDHVRNNYPVTFADDGRTICQERFALAVTRDYTAPRTMHVFAPDGREIQVIDEAPADAPPGLRWYAGECSISRDSVTFVGYHHQPDEVVQSTLAPSPSSTPSGNVVRAQGMGMSVSVHRGPVWVVMVRTVRLSTGREISRHVYPDNTMASLGLAADGSAQIEQPFGQYGRVVRDLRNGRTVSLPGKGGTEFVGTDSRDVLITDNHGQRKDGVPIADFTLFDWRANRVLWHDTVVGFFDVWHLQPDGTEMTIFAQGMSGDGCSPVRDTDMIDQNGTVVPLLRSACQSS